MHTSDSRSKLLQYLKGSLLAFSSLFDGHYEYIHTYIFVDVWNFTKVGLKFQRQNIFANYMLHSLTIFIFGYYFFGMTKS